MIYTSVNQIYEAIDETRERLYLRVEGLNEERANKHPHPNTWSVRDILEHLAIMEGRLSRMMLVMLAKAEAASPKSKGAPVEIKSFSLDKFIERSRDEKYVAPESVSPGGDAAVPLRDLLARLRQSRAELHSLRPRIEATDLSTVTYPHPVFGALNFYEWLAFIGMHEERHLRQMERVLAA